MGVVPIEATIIAPGKANKPLASRPHLLAVAERMPEYNTRVKLELGSEQAVADCFWRRFGTGGEVPILQAPEAFPTLSFALT
jgi:hypothetical protein